MNTNMSTINIASNNGGYSEAVDRSSQETTESGDENDNFLYIRFHYEGTYKVHDT